MLPWHEAWEFITGYRRCFANIALLLCQDSIAAVHEGALSLWQGMLPAVEAMTNGHELPEKSTSPTSIAGTSIG